MFFESVYVRRVNVRVWLTDITVRTSSELKSVRNSTIIYVKSKKRAALSDRHLDDLLILGTTKLTPQFDELLKR